MQMDALLDGSDLDPHQFETIERLTRAKMARPESGTIGAVPPPVVALVKSEAAAAAAWLEGGKRAAPGNEDRAAAEHFHAHFVKTL